MTTPHDGVRSGLFPEEVM